MQTRSTFVTHNGNKAPIKSYYRFILVLYLAIRRKYFKIYPEMPWIPFSAIHKLDKIIKDDWKILEIGSGMSTIWLSKRANHVVSIEADEKWYNTLLEKIKHKRITNIDLRYEWKGEKMADFSEFPDEYFDLIYIDGGPRERCCNNAKTKVKKGGFIYLDNSDNKSLSENGTEVLKKLVAFDSNKIEIFVDFVPGNLMVNEGIMIHV